MTQNRGTAQLASARADFPIPTAAARRSRLTGRPALYLLASLVVSLLAGSAAPTPLYAIYQRQWGFSPITTTIVFGVYAVAVLAALLTLGRLSDSVGRRPVLLAALGVQVLSMLVFATAGGVGELMAARDHPGARHRGRARRHRGGHARRRPGARRARQRPVPRSRHRQRRAGLGAVRPVPARAHAPDLLRADRGLRRPGDRGRAAAGDRDAGSGHGDRVRARGPAAARGARPGAGRGAGALRRLGAGRPVRRARPRARPDADRVRERGARRGVA